MAINREKVQETAEKLIARGKIEAGIQEYRKLLSDTPKDIALLNKVGDLYVRINRNDEAVRLFLQLAGRYSEDGFFVKAIAIYKKILKFDPTRLVVYEKLADLYHKQGLANEARAQYQVLVDYHQKHGDAKSASAVLEKMAELDPDDPTPRVKLADAAHQAGDRDAELKEYRALAEMMMRRGRFDEAGQVFAKAIAAAPDDLAFMTDAVLGLKDAGQVAAAARLLTIAVEKNPLAERIAKLAGIGRESPRATESTGVRERPAPARRPSGELDLRAIAPPPAPSPPPVARPVPVEEPDLIVELPVDEAPSTEVRPTEEMLRRSPDSPWFEGAESSEVEFELEIEAISEAEAPPAAALPPAVQPALPPPIEPPPIELPPVELPPPGPVAPIEWDFAAPSDLELDLSLPELQDVPATGWPEPATGATELPPPAGVSPFEVGLDLEELERTSYEVVPAEVPIARRLGDLLAEAEVFRKYGLREKAHDRVREILHHDPQHFEAMGLQVTLLLEEGKHDKALARAQQLSALAEASAAGAEIWAAVQQRLAKAGFKFDEERPVAAPPPKKQKRDSVTALLEDLAELAGTPKKAKAAPARAEPAPPKAPAPQPVPKPPEIAPPRPAAPRPSAAPPAPPKPVPPARPAAAPAARPPGIAPLPAARPAAAAASSAPPPAPSPSTDEALAWLDQAGTAAPRPAGAAAKPSADEKLFEDEEGFFDLAAELEEELTKEELLAATAPLTRDEPSLEEIVEGFKKGVAESLSAEDYDTHFNLGIAYREMGLIDEAIGEFQLAAKDPKYLIDCCSLLGGCFLDKGLPELGIKWFRKGLEVPDLPEEATLGLLYDLGNLYLATGDNDKARKTFVEVYGVNSNYRDVVAKLEELGSH